ncbi:uncharacterized protein C8Q71DRAFT_717903 [Rhodofomes roseus]|uniref:DUF4218 domain-containing protein n=1 Tax=Rhodofomes roseus TaxID=34475 RepID=A0ABQ8K055_9APHY|nr:uncharacterized protein C8Q71DRAFT_717903 [Rhodofomes roseus]KAH9829722.1 hypothetical protein C8Q71DRAFT_717903 [Rhodofomes roseus]
MHNLFLGELRHHCMAVWGIDIKDHKDKTVKKTVEHTPEEQQRHLDRLIDALRKGVLSAVAQPRKGYLVALAQFNSISPQKLTKHEYAKALLAWVNHGVDHLAVPPVLKSDTADFHLANGPHDISKFRILTPEIVDQLRCDIKSTYLPSWVERPPLNFGSASHGKLKADHWRTVCTINMVVTLTRIWGRATASTAEHHLLDNFIHLVVAVDLASRRSMSAERARLYDHHMLEYLRTLRELFEHNLVPNHHLSLHLSTCLMLFGPVHGWWAYPFERFNGIIQRLKTNNQTDKIPLTYMRIFHAAAELRWRIASADWPKDDSIHEVLNAFKNVYQDAARGTRVIDVLGALPGYGEDVSYKDIYAGLSDAKLDRVIYNTLVDVMNCAGRNTDFASFYSPIGDRRMRLSPLVRFVSKLDLSGVTYGTRDSNIRNSFICFLSKTSADRTLVRAGQISSIFLHSRNDPESNARVVEPFFIVDQYVPLSQDHAANDPYRRFPLLDTQLYYDRFSEQTALIHSADIVAHFASFAYVPEEIGESCIVVRSLDRVCGSR